MLFEFLANRVLAELDPVTSIRHDPAHVGVITKAIKRANPNEQLPLTRPKARWDFLEAARRHLSAITDYEELLVAFGTGASASRSGRSRLTSLYRSVGENRSVALSPELLGRLNRTAASPGEEALVVHNHPPFWLRHLAIGLGLWRPTASSPDRELSFAFEQKMLNQWIAIGRSGRVRWYLVDEGQISEFRVPSARRIAAVLQALDKG